MQAKIKEKVPEAMFTHRYAHKLNLVQLQSACPSLMHFIKPAEGLFSKSTKCSHLVDDQVPFIQTINLHQNDLHALFHFIMENPDRWNNDTLMMAAGYNQWLSKAVTYFLLTGCECVFNGTDALFKVMQNKVLDTEYCLTRMHDTAAALERRRLAFDSFYDQFE